MSSIDTSGISALEEMKKKLDLRKLQVRGSLKSKFFNVIILIDHCVVLNLIFAALQLVMANPGRQTIEKLNNSKFTEFLGKKWLFLTVDEAVGVCKTLLHREMLDNACN